MLENHTDSHWRLNFNSIQCALYSKKGIMMRLQQKIERIFKPSLIFPATRVVNYLIVKNPIVPQCPLSAVIIKLSGFSGFQHSLHLSKSVSAGIQRTSVRYIAFFCIVKKRLSVTDLA